MGSHFGQPSDWGQFRAIAGRCRPGVVGAEMILAKLAHAVHAAVLMQLGGAGGGLIGAGIIGYSKARNEDGTG